MASQRPERPRSPSSDRERNGAWAPFSEGSPSEAFASSGELRSCDLSAYVKSRGWRGLVWLRLPGGPGVGSRRANRPLSPLSKVSGAAAERF